MKKEPRGKGATGRGRKSKAGGTEKRTWRAGAERKRGASKKDIMRLFTFEKRTNL